MKVDQEDGTDSEDLEFEDDGFDEMGKQFCLLLVSLYKEKKNIFVFI